MGLVLLGMVTVFSVVPRKVVFSYAGKTCFTQVTVLPLLHRDNSAEMDVTYESVHSIGSFEALSTKTCVESAVPPEPKDYFFRNSLLGSLIIGRNTIVSVPSTPKVNVSVLSTKISSVKPIELKLSAQDTIFDYSLAVGDKSADCKPVAGKLACDVKPLGLPQGTTAEYALRRSFNDSHETTLAKGMLRTLEAVKVNSSSVTPNQTVYDALSSIVIQTDKPLARASVSLKKSGADVQGIATKVEANTLSIVSAKPFDRESDYQLTVETLEATDGSGLDAPLVLPFRTSGGPTVKAVSVGSSNISANASIAITFDQPIAANVDTKAFVTVTGATSTISRTNNQIIVRLQNAPLCGAVSISVAKGLTGTNGVVAANGWSYTTRVECGRQEVIGYSVKGRPIIAYYFGSGATKILFTGGMHGSERSGYTTMQSFVTHLMANAHKIPAGKQIVIVPNTNPDGIAAGTRYNARKVNLDRNFPTANWLSSYNTANGYETGSGGPSAGSEPETAALMALTSKLRPRMEVSFHSRGSLVGANKIGDSRAVGATYAALTGYGTMFDTAEEVMGGYPMTGEYEDWIGEGLGLPAILVELPGHSSDYFSSQVTALWRMINL